MAVDRRTPRPRTRIAPWFLVAALLTGGCDDLSLLRGLPGGGAGLCEQAQAPCAKEALFCEGFETANDAMFPGWNVGLGNYMGSPADPATQALATSSPVCRGQRSLSVRTVGSTQYAFLHRTAAMPNPVYVRFYYYRPTSSDPSSLQVLQLSDTNAGKYGQLGLNPDGMVWEGAAFYRFPFTPVRDRWTCVEWSVKVDATQGTLSLRIDDNPVGSYSGIDTRISSGVLDAMTIGATVGSGVSGVVQMYYDDIVVSAAPIGC